jgi:hypothetical protein
VLELFIDTGMTEGGAVKFIARRILFYQVKILGTQTLLLYNGTYFSNSHNNRIVENQDHLVNVPSI